MSVSKSIGTTGLVIGGKLTFKNDKNKGGKKQKSATKAPVKETTSSSATTSSATTSTSAEFLTESQKRNKTKNLAALEAREVKAVVQNSYRDRVENFNHMLGTMSEHNDIPRISAAGNG